MVLLDGDIALVAFEMLEQEFGTLGKRSLIISHPMSLEVRLRDKVDTHLVAEVVPAGIVGIV